MASVIRLNQITFNRAKRVSNLPKSRNFNQDYPFPRGIISAIS